MVCFTVNVLPNNSRPTARPRIPTWSKILLAATKPRERNYRHARIFARPPTNGPAKAGRGPICLRPRILPRVRLRTLRLAAVKYKRSGLPLPRRWSHQPALPLGAEMRRDHQLLLEGMSQTIVSMRVGSQAAAAAVLMPCLIVQKSLAGEITTSRQFGS